ncbi:unnamed protein product, partial [Closterium sp. Naga37s-1]
MRFDPVGLSLPNHYPIARSAIPIGRTAPFAQYSCEFRSANPAASRNVLSQCNRPRCLLIRRFPRSRNQITMSADVAQTADVAEPADWRVLITFDVDGTLIHSVGSESNKLHKRAFAHAMKKVFGIQGTIDAIQHHGSTDQAVLINTLEFYGIPRHVTGNLEAIAWLKMAGLEVASLFTAPRIGGFGSDHMDRGELVRIARQRAEERIAGPPFRLHAHVGDT